MCRKIGCNKNVRNRVFDETENEIQGRIDEDSLFLRCW
jgi:hypothetical protein